MSNRQQHKRSDSSSYWSRFYRVDEILEQGDELLIFTALALTGFGIIMVYSSSFYIAEYKIFLKQLIIGILGVCALITGMFLDTRIYKKLILPGVIVTISLLMLQLFTPLGPVKHGTRRWIEIAGFTFQTVELARVILIIYIAHVLSEHPDIGRAYRDKNFWLFLIIPFTIFGLVFAQPDLSSTGMLILICVTMFFLAGYRISYFLVTGMVIFPPVYMLLKPYQKERLVGYVTNLIPGSTGAEWPYQQLQSFIAFVRGSVSGGGLAQGCQTMQYLPEAHNDFIYAIIGEEFGWIGATCVLAAIIFLFVRGTLIAMKQPDRYGFLLASGLVVSLMLYAMVNMGVCVGLLPVTGLPLPFISAGGTSLVFCLWSVGVIWRLSTRVKREF